MGRVLAIFDRETHGSPKHENGFGSPHDRLKVGWIMEGYRESRRCSRDTYSESHITKYTSIRIYIDREKGRNAWMVTERRLSADARGDGYGTHKDSPGQILALAFR